MKIGWVAAAGMTLIAALSIAAGAQKPGDIVHWSAAASTGQTAKPNQKLTATLHATIADGWHIYSITQPPGGPIATDVSVPAGQPLTLAGNVRQPKPDTSYDANFSMNTEFYEDQVSFTVPLAVAASAKSGELRGTIDVRFQACNERFCLPPSTAHVPLSLQVVPGAPR